MKTTKIAATLFASLSLATAAAQETATVETPKAESPAALERQRQGYSLDGLIPPAGAAALYQVLRRFEPSVQAAANLDVTKAFTNQFVQKAMTSRQPR